MTVMALSISPHRATPVAPVSPDAGLIGLAARLRQRQADALAEAATTADPSLAAYLRCRAANAGCEAGGVEASIRIMRTKGEFVGVAA